MVNIPPTGRAWMIVKQGVPHQALKLEPTHAVPKLTSGEVLVKVQAAALNPVGYKIMRMLPNIVARRPVIAEHDLAGVVVDANGTEFKEGDEVFGFIPVELQFKTHQGAIAEFTKLPQTHLARKPSNVTFAEAAGVSLAGETALQGLFDVGKLQPGQTLFVNGGSSAVGGFAIQIAKAKGCKVVTSASGKNEEYVKSLGADEFVDYTKEPLHEHFTKNPPSPKFNLIFDAVGLVDPSLYTHSEAYLEEGGLFVSTGPNPGMSRGDILSLFRTLREAFLRPSWLGGSKRAWKLIGVRHKPDDLYTLRDLLAEGKLKPTVDSIFAFEDTLQAYDRILTSRAKGKVVVKVDAKAA